MFLLNNTATIQFLTTQSNADSYHVDLPIAFTTYYVGCLCQTNGDLRSTTNLSIPDKQLTYFIINSASGERQKPILCLLVGY